MLFGIFLKLFNGCVLSEVVVRDFPEVEEVDGIDRGTEVDDLL